MKHIWVKMLLKSFLAYSTEHFTFNLYFNQDWTKWWVKIPPVCSLNVHRRLSDSSKYLFCALIHIFAFVVPDCEESPINLLRQRICGSISRPSLLHQQIELQQLSSLTLENIHLTRQQQEPWSASESFNKMSLSKHLWPFFHYKTSQIVIFCIQTT